MTRTHPSRSADYLALLKGERWHTFKNAAEHASLVKAGLVWGDPPHADDEKPIDSWLPVWTQVLEVKKTASSFGPAAPVEAPRVVRHVIKEDAPRPLWSTLAALHAKDNLGHDAGLVFDVLTPSGKVYGTFHYGPDGWRWS